MSEYFVTKREKCEACNGDGKEKRRSLMISADDPIECHECDGFGYIDTPVDLLEVLAKVRWTEIGDIITSNGYEKGVVDLRFNNLTIED